jgi:hypothetical protein
VADVIVFTDNRNPKTVAKEIAQRLSEDATKE